MPKVNSLKVISGSCSLRSTQCGSGHAELVKGIPEDPGGVSAECTANAKGGVQMAL